MGRRNYIFRGCRVLAVLALLTASACQTTATGAVGVAAPAPAESGGVGDSPDAVYSDPCAGRLHNLCGPLLEYYALHHQLPARLEDLQSVADEGTKLDFTCPVSGLEYVYVPDGLEAVGHTKRIIAYDAQPVHNGKRWCLFWQPPRPGGALSAEVLLLSQGIFQTYQPVGN